MQIKKVEDPLPKWLTSKKRYPIEKALDKLLREVYELIKAVRGHLQTKPKDKMELIIKTVEIAIWLFLTYDIAKGFLGWGR